MTITLPAIAPQLPVWPDGVPAPTVTVDFPPNAVETYVEINGERVQFWRWEGDGHISNTFDHGLHFAPADRPWMPLSPYDRMAALAWGTAVQARAEYALVALRGTVVEAGSPEAAAILACATVTEQGPISSEDSSAARMDAALELWPETEDGAQSRIQDMLTDVRHYCKRHGLDLEAALADSADAFESESGSPSFTDRS